MVRDVPAAGGAIRLPDMSFKFGFCVEEAVLTPMLARFWNRSYLLCLSLHRHFRRDLVDGTVALPGRDLPSGDPREG